jgi:hypothetical protein
MFIVQEVLLFLYALFEYGLTKLPKASSRL